MKLCFDSIDEVKDFVKQLKGGRRTKGDADDTDEGATASNLGPATGAAPPPIMPPTGQAQTFQPGPGTAPFTPPPATANTMPAIVGRIVARVDALIAGTVPGQPAQPAEAVTQWLRGELGKVNQAAAGATLDQIKQSLLPQMPEAVLNQIASLIGA